MQYWIETYGCQMNKAESDALELELNGCGWKEAQVPENASLVIINTCSVRKTAEDRIWGRIGYFKRIKKDNPDQKLFITGCMAQRLGDQLKENKSPVDEVFGTFDKDKIIDFISSENTNKSGENAIYKFKKNHSGKNTFKSFIPIMNGCNNFCSYCIVPYVRGREISRKPSDIYSEIETLEKDKIKEITLLGQNVNSYTYMENNASLYFPGLLTEISSMVKSIEWIRFLTSHPKDLSIKLIVAIADSSNICKHIHLPLQSGSDNILSMMNRGYNSKYYLTLVENIKKNIPGVSITTDIITGFPGETEDDFKLTCEMMERVKFSDAFTYYYNPRIGTEAYNFPNEIEKEVKLERLSRIIDLQKKISLDSRKAKLGYAVKVLAEGYSKNSKSELLGRTESDEMIVFTGKHDKIGKFNNVKIISLKGNTFTGELIE
jgi:tRNA-2-methylthio-N6-dimethylallyladenosine synthase